MNSYLDQLLRLHWLRPETALWRTFDCLLMEQHGPISGRSIDLGCGDGTLSFVMAGGTIDGYDVFMDVERIHGYNAGEDIYNQPTDVTIRPDYANLRYTYEYGVDHKEWLVQKAKRFSRFYRNNVVADLNHPLRFDNASFDSGFSNVLYWLDDLDWVLSEWARVLKRRGTLALFVPNENFKEKAWLYYGAPNSDEKEYLNYFDRGYNALIRHCYRSKNWIEIFARNGFAVRGHHLYLTDPVMEIWNIGVRPIAPLVISMAKALSPKEREIAKVEWVEYFSRFFKPIVEGEFGRKVPESQAAFHFFILEKP